MKPRTADQEADRLMQLLDIGLEQLQAGDGEATLLALQEALSSAERLPKRSDVICLPDQSKAEDGPPSSTLGPSK